MLKRLIRSRAVQGTLGYLLARYLRFVERTNRLAMEPEDAYEHVGPLQPVIVAMWHGQHFMIHFGRRPQDPVSALISRHADGEFNAIALRHLGVNPIRGSGAPAGAAGRKVAEKGGVSALRAMLKALQGGDMMVLTADVPKVARVCGMGIVLLAKLSGRPIVPTAVVTSRRLVFRKSWDRAVVGLPFGRGAVVIGEPIHVAADADEAAMEAARRAVELGLDRVHARAYARIGRDDPGAALAAAREARLATGAAGGADA